MDDHSAGGGVLYMIFVTGPKFSGKEKCICEMLSITHEEFLRTGIRDVEMKVAGDETESELEKLAEELAKNTIVIASEIGSGVISTDPKENEYRSRAGLLSQMLAKRAQVVVRVICGIPQILKGSL